MQTETISISPHAFSIYTLKSPKGVYDWHIKSGTFKCFDKITVIHKAACIHIKKDEPLFVLLSQDNTAGLLIPFLSLLQKDADDRNISASLYIECDARDLPQLSKIAAALLVEKYQTNNAYQRLINCFVKYVETKRNEFLQAQILRDKTPIMPEELNIDVTLPLEPVLADTFNQHIEIKALQQVIPTTPQIQSAYASYLLTQVRQDTPLLFISSSHLTDGKLKTLLKPAIIKGFAPVIVLHANTAVHKIKSVLRKKTVKAFLIWAIVIGALLAISLSLAERVNYALENEINELRENKLALEKQSIKLKSDLESLKKDKELFEKSIAGMRSDTSIEVFRKAKNELNELKNKKKELQDKINTVKEQLRKAVEEKDNAIAKKQKMLDELSALVDQRRNELFEDITKPLNEQIQELQAQLQEKNKEIAELKNELENKQQAVKNAPEDTAETSNEQIQEKEKIIIELQNKLENIEGKRQAAKEKLEKFLKQDALNANDNKNRKSVEETLVDTLGNSFYRKTYCDNYLDLRETAEKLGTVDLGENLCDGYKKSR